MKVWWPGAVVAVAVLGLGALNSVLGPDSRVALAAAAGGGGFVAVAGAATLAFRRKVQHDLPDAGLIRAVRTWDAGEVGSLQAWASDLVSQDAAAHAARTASLCQLMADQLAVRPDGIDDLILAAFAHVAPAAFETGDGSCTRFSPGAIHHAVLALEKAGHPESARIMTQVGERWDGLGSPVGLAGEATSLRGRVLGAACAFDLASSAGLEAGLRAIREGSGSAFDPVVAAELLHLFREPWQLRQVA